MSYHFNSLLMSGISIAQALIARSAIENEIRKLERELEYVEANISGCETDQKLHFISGECQRQSANRLHYELYPRQNQLNNEINRLRNAPNSITY